jgi:hypothetical protein
MTKFRPKMSGEEWVLSFSGNRSADYHYSTYREAKKYFDEHKVFSGTTLRLLHIKILEKKRGRS